MDPWLLQLAEPNEPGVFIGKIQAKNPARQFLGYVDKTASEKKVVRNVFTHGDSAFISGSFISFFILNWRFLQVFIFIGV